MEYFIPSDKSVTLLQRQTKQVWPSQIWKIFTDDPPLRSPGPPAPPPNKKRTFPKWEKISTSKKCLCEP